MPARTSPIFLPDTSSLPTPRSRRPCRDQVHVSVDAGGDDPGRDVVDHVAVERFETPDHVVPGLYALFPLPDVLPQDAR